MTQYIGAVPESAKQQVITVDQRTATRNYLTNSDFEINQREYAGGALLGGVHGYDRWDSNVANSTMTVSGIVATIDHTTASTEGIISQRIEVGTLITGRQYTLSWVGTAEASVWHANGDALNYVSGGKLTFIADAGSGNINEFILFKGDGATFSEAKLEEGASATLWEKPDPATELVKCQRYFVAFGGDAVYERFGFGYSLSATQAIITVPLPVTMRAVPIVSYSGAISTLAVWCKGAILAASAINMNNSSKNKPAIIITSSGITAGEYAELISNNSVAPRLYFDAEI